MNKTNLRSLNPNWKGYEALSPATYISSKQLAGILGVHQQTICNWRNRGILPASNISKPKKRGNICWYKISAVRALLEGKSEHEIHANWLKRYWGLENLTPKEVAFYTSAVNEAYQPNS